MKKMFNLTLILISLCVFNASAEVFGFCNLECVRGVPKTTYYKLPTILTPYTSFEQCMQIEPVLCYGNRAASLIPFCANTLKKILPPSETLNWSNYDLVRGFGTIEASAWCSFNIRDVDQSPEPKTIKVPNMRPVAPPTTEKRTPVQPGPGSGMLYKDTRPLSPSPVLIPLPINGIPILVPVMPGTPTGDFIIEVARITSKATPIVIAAIIAVLFACGIVAAIGALGAVETGGASLVLSAASIKAAGIAIIAICAAWNISVNKNVLNPSSGPRAFIDSRKIPEQLDVKGARFQIESLTESTFSIHQENNRAICAVVDTESAYVDPRCD